MRKELFTTEKELARPRDAERPPGADNDDREGLVLERPPGKVRLDDISNGRGQLIVYHYDKYGDAPYTNPIAIWQGRLLSLHCLRSSRSAYQNNSGG